MAYIHTANCNKCGKQFQACNDNYTCHDCYEVEQIKKKKKYMIDIREGKSLEERVSQVEEWIYHNKDKVHSYEDMTYK